MLVGTDAAAGRIGEGVRQANVQVSTRTCHVPEKACWVLEYNENDCQSYCFLETYCVSADPQHILCIASFNSQYSCEYQ